MRSPTPAPRCAENHSSFTSTRTIYAHAIALLVLTALSAGIMPGCAIRTPAATDRHTTDHAPAEIAWPARWTDDLRAVAAALPKRYGERRTIAQHRRNDAGEWTSGELNLVLHEVVHAEAHGMGIVREVRRARGEDAPVRFIRVAHGSDGASDEHNLGGPRRMTLNFISWQDEPDEQLVRDDSRTAYWRKVSSVATLEMPATDNVRGLVIAFGPHTTTPWSLRDRLQERGWAVLQLGATRPAGGVERPSFEFDHETSIEHVAAVIADAVDHRIAEYVYAAEAAVEYLQHHVSRLRGAPVAVVGVSRGALVAPAVAARFGDRADAVVLAIGGANLMSIAQATTFKDHQLLTITWRHANGSERTLNRSERRSFSSAYLDASRLDPYHVAPHLRDTRTLLITAAFDHVIPASAGRLLYERLERPERWHYLLGHVVTFWLHNRRPDLVIDWLEEAIDRPAAERMYADRTAAE